MVAAAELARHGVRTLLLDKAADVAAHSHAAVLHVRTLEVLEAMGIAERFVRQSFPLEYISLHAFGKSLGGLRLYGTDGPFSGPRTISQHDVETLLALRLDELGVTVERRAELIGLTQDEDGVTLRLGGPDGAESTLRAAFAIGCDGAHSTVRDALGIGFDGERYESFEFVHADCTVRWSYPSGRGYTFVGQDRFLALFPFDAAGSYRVLCARPAPANAEAGEPSLAELQAILRETVDPAADLVEPRWLARWHSGHRIARNFALRRVFLAGDAAHVHVPVGGQGMNIGIQDAFNLAWKLAAVVRGEAAPALADTYEPERRPIAEEVIRGTDRGFHLMVQPGDFASFALKLFGSSVIGLERVQERLRRVLGETAYGYVGGTLSEDLGGTVGPLAGERVIDGVVVRARDRVTLRFLEAIRGEAWPLVLFAGSEGAPVETAVLETVQAALARFGGQLRAFLVTPGAAPGDWPGDVLYDREHLLHDRYGVRGAVFYLIRPDWYVGFRGPAARGEALLGYLGKWLTQK
jgi:3-(3-hydroxy-phenyl)propionate hydroxylase